MLDAPDDSPDESPQGKKKSKRSQSSRKQNKKKKLDFSTSGYHNFSIHPANPMYHRWAYPRKRLRIVSVSTSASGHVDHLFPPFSTLPCNHTGPCEPGFNCICYQKAHRCKRNCPCDKKCEYDICICNLMKRGSNK